MAAKSDALAAATDFANKPALKAATSNYLDQLDRSYLPGSRLKQILELLKSKKGRIRGAAAKASIHPVSIAAAIAWEFSQNWLGFMTDKVLSIGLQEGWGYGSFHRESLKKFLGLQTETEVFKIRSDLDLSIDAIARYTAWQRDVFRRDSGGIDLGDWPAGLAWLYNTDPDFVAQVAVRKKTAILAGEMPKMQIVNDMAGWTEANLGLFEWLTPKSRLPAGSVKYERTVREDEVKPKISERAIY